MSNRPAVIAAVLCAALIGCRSAPKVEEPEKPKGVPVTIESSPTGARVEVDGFVRGATPVTVLLKARAGWPKKNDKEYLVEVFPPADGAGRLFTQHRRIKPAQLPEDGGRMFFDLTLESVNPRQTIEIREGK